MQQVETAGNKKQKQAIRFSFRNKIAIMNKHNHK